MSENEKTDAQILDDLDETQAETSAEPEQETGGDGGGTTDAPPEPDPLPEESPPDPAEEPEARPHNWLPRWKCHKTVEAFKITSINPMTNGRIYLVGGDADCGVTVESDYVDKHRPQVGGYYVKYHDGYASWSPADAFEDGYSLI